MRMLPFLILLPTTDSSRDVSLEYQQELLRAVFHEISQVYSARIFLGTPCTDITIRGEEVHNPLKTLTLKYTEKYLRLFSVQRLRAGNFRIEWTPHSVRELRVFRSNQRFTLKSRCFPRESILIDLNHNMITGEIDLETLPRNIGSLKLMNNNLKGTLSFFRLPSSLRVIDLSQNPFYASVVYYGEVPKNLEMINLRGSHITPQPLSDEYYMKHWGIMIV